MHLLVIGMDEIVINKYMPLIESRIHSGDLNGYSIIDLESQKRNISNSIDSLSIKPSLEFFFSDDEFTVQNNFFNEDLTATAINQITALYGELKVYIATEVRAHEGYLLYCIQNDIQTLTEKPLIAPFSSGRFDCTGLKYNYKELIDTISKFSSPERHSVMTLSRYHEIYNFNALNSIRDLMINNDAPISSLHFRHAGGVHNRLREYSEREDHPYKYGYGMVMHGGYHYLDLVTQFLELNKLLIDEELELAVRSFSAHPIDQSARIAKSSSKAVNDEEPLIDESLNEMGETDIVCSYKLMKKKSRKIVTIGTVSLEQTTPSIRTWGDFPEGQYNKNGRTSSVDVEVQLSVLHSMNIKCYDVPVLQGKNIDRIDARADILQRSNCEITKHKSPVTLDTYTGLFHSDSNKSLMNHWLEGKEHLSTIGKHKNVNLFSYAMLESANNDGKEVRFTL
ncbi:hypothetical protein [Reinekea marinisedimentorum]|uniref:Uncharacterized protein n=1 Tax=Reinekea marinisedimentorum TaxID=230495 RepID=A0A4R3HUH5_9GAMM|nr:hypothetical protein [Reinekea marinisedimentorum]TCS36698.1 hypothetical protein BCF53_12320 [Reinekea marinisedimentorum]